MKQKIRILLLKIKVYLSVARKYKYSCIYIFHIINPKKWKLILFQRKIFNTFTGSVEQASILRILLVNFSRETVPYVPRNYFWIKTLFISLGKRNDKACLTINFRGNNPMTQANFEQEWTMRRRNTAILILGETISCTMLSSVKGS